MSACGVNGQCIPKCTPLCKSLERTPQRKRNWSWECAVSYVSSRIQELLQLNITRSRVTRCIAHTYITARWATGSETIPHLYLQYVKESVPSIIILSTFTVYQLASSSKVYGNRELNSPSLHQHLITHREPQWSHNDIFKESNRHITLLAFISMFN